MEKEKKKSKDFFFFTIFYIFYEIDIKTFLKSIISQYFKNIY